MWFTTISLLAAILVLGNAAILKDVNADNLDEFIEQLERKRSDVIENDASVKGCGGQPADIVFILDDSRSIPEDDFDKQIDFVSDFVKIFEISPDKVRVGVVTFGDKIISKSTFPFTQYTEEESLVKGISSIKFAPDDGGSTQTGLAINYARKNIFNIARPGIEKIAIILTDGKSTESTKTMAEASLAKQEGILMIAIGVTSGVSLEELKAIASGSDYVFTVESFDALKQIKIQLGMKTCRVTTTAAPITTTTPAPTTTTTTLPPTTPQMDQPCDKEIDVNFVFDSGMMGDKGTNDVIKFIKSSISDEALDKSNIRFGTVAGPCNKVYGFDLNEYTTKDGISNHFDQFHVTAIAPLIKETYEQSYKLEHGGRAGARKVAVIFLKGKLKDPVELIEQAKFAREAGVEVFVVNMDHMNSKTILESIVSPKEEEHILDREGVDMLLLSGEFSHRLCTSKKPDCV